MNGADLSEYIIHFSYAGIFLWFAFFEQLTPIPEEVSLMLIGYLSVHAGLNPWASGVSAIVGLTTADIGIYWLALHGSKFIKKINIKQESALTTRIRDRMLRHPVRTIILLALLPKFRFVSPVVAAGSGISLKIYFPANMIATLAYSIGYMLAGIFFHARLHEWMEKFERIQHTIFILLMAVISLMISIVLRRTMAKKWG